jgi:sarcosine oxidase subunit alpha
MIAGRLARERFGNGSRVGRGVARAHGEDAMVVMMASRLGPPKRPVEVELDGERLPADQGEPIAFALIAAGKLALSRSPKLHRPHGPYCLRGACDGCLLRVNGEPNVMTCMRACVGGEKLESQNVLGSRKVDLMQATDWFFPGGIDHHHFMAGVPAASYVVQKIARHVAGLGRLPDEPLPLGTARREEVDVLIVGAGPAGLTVAQRLRGSSTRPKRRLLVVDDGATPGGSLLARGASTPEASRVDLLDGATAAGVYDREVLVIREGGAIVVRPRVLVLATGAHDGVAAFEGNDLPGVFSARAAARLAHSDIAVGKKVALLGSGPYSASFVLRMGTAVEVIEVPPGGSISAEGRGRVTSITIETERASLRPRSKATTTKKRRRVDALLVEVPGAPSFELASQAGAHVAFDVSRGGYVPITDPNGRALPWMWCAGELSGTGSALEAIEEQARTVARDVERVLSDPSALESRPTTPR